MGDTVVISKSVESVTSGAETIPYVDEWSMIERAATTSSSVSTITIKDENGDHLNAHHYIVDWPEAPFTQEILMEEVSNEETERVRVRESA